MTLGNTISGGVTYCYTVPREFDTVTSRGCAAWCQAMTQRFDSVIPLHVTPSRDVGLRDVIFLFDWGKKLESPDLTSRNLNYVIPNRHAISRHVKWSRDVMSRCEHVVSRNTVTSRDFNYLAIFSGEMYERTVGWADFLRLVTSARQCFMILKYLPILNTQILFNGFLGNTS